MPQNNQSRKTAYRYPKHRTFFEKCFAAVADNVGTKIVSVVMAILLWGLVLGSRSVEVTKDIPLDIITSPDIVPENDIPEKITFRLSGPKAFLRGILDRPEEPIHVNLTRDQPALVTYRFASDNIHLPIGVKVLSISPSAIAVKLESVKRREVPVRVELRGSPPEGFRVARVEVRPETVMIRGAESLIDGLAEILTLPYDVSFLKKNFEKELPLDLANGRIKLESEPPRVLVEIEPITANFRIRNVDIHVLSSYRVRLEEKSVTVFVRSTTLEEIQSLDRNQIYGMIDLTGRKRGNYDESVKVILPKNIGLVKVVPEHVHVTIF